MIKAYKISILSAIIALMGVMIAFLFMPNLQNKIQNVSAYTQPTLKISTADDFMAFSQNASYWF